MASDLVEIIHSLRMQMGQKSGATLSTLTLAFRFNDVNKSGCFDFYRFEEILHKVGLFVRRQELTKLYRHFDTERNETVNYREFLKALQGDVSERRQAMIRKVWDALACGSECIAIKHVIGSWTARKHPKVLSGEKTEHELFREFVANFESTGNANGMIGWEQFSDFYRAISASVPYDDDHFIRELETVWDVSEMDGEVGVSTTLLRKVQAVLREKVRQRSRTTASEVETLRLGFKYFDNFNTGLVGFDDFKAALSRFGMVLDEQVYRGLFEEFDTSASGKIDYAHFAGVVYQDDPLSSSYRSIAAAGDRVQSDRSFLETEDMLVSYPVPSAAAAPIAGALGGKVSVVFVLGGPAAGKTTQSLRIHDEFGFVYLSPPDLLQRETQTEGSPYRTEILEAIQSGRTVPVNLTISILSREIEAYVAEGKTHFVLDGFPRTKAHFDAWIDLMSMRADVPIVINLDAPLHVCETRMVKRAQTQEVVDSEEQKERGKRLIKQKLDDFTRDTSPVIDLFSRLQKLAVVPAAAPVSHVYAQVREVILEVVKASVPAEL